MPGSCYSNLAFALVIELQVDPHGPRLAGQSPQRPDSLVCNHGGEWTPSRVSGRTWKDGGTFT